MTPAELFALIVSALVDLELDTDDERGKRIYLAYLAARVGQGGDGVLERRLAELRKDLSL